MGKSQVVGTVKKKIAFLLIGILPLAASWWAVDGAGRRLLGYILAVEVVCYFGTWAAARAAQKGRWLTSLAATGILLVCLVLSGLGRAGWGYFARN
jgi:hypothetical protein